MNSTRLARRSFLKAVIPIAGAIALPAIIPARVLGRNGSVAPSERIVLGGVGLGPRGQYDLSVSAQRGAAENHTHCGRRSIGKSREYRLADSVI
jgi:hypothetical protein